jgi:hypothetical protein
MTLLTLPSLPRWHAVKVNDGVKMTMNEKSEPSQNQKIGSVAEEEEKKKELRF